MNDNINMNTNIEESMNDNISMGTEIEGSINDNIIYFSVHVYVVIH
jgi:hypothetical protein